LIPQREHIPKETVLTGLGAVAFTAQAVKDRDELLARLQADAKAGDCVLLVGARDPSLPALVKKIVDLFGGKSKG